MEEKQMIFKFKVLSVEDEKFVRDYELRYDSTLLDFHRLICEDLGFESEEMASFFLSNKNWEKLREFTLMDMDDDADESESSPISMDKIALGQIIRQKHERLIYTYDLLNDRGLFIELIESHTGKKNIDYPYVAFAQGDAPLQYGGEREGAIFSEMMGDFEDEFDDKFDDDDDAYKGGGLDDDFGGGFNDYDDDDDDYGSGGGGYGGGSYNDDYY